MMKIFSPEDIEGKSLYYIVSDVDDTITKNGRLYPSALSALYKAEANNFKTILLTGGSSGWADAYIRQWPVSAVIAESGALLILKDNGKIKYIENKKLEDGSYQEKRRALLSETKSFPFSSDQYARIYDVAYEKAFLSPKDREKLINILSELSLPYLESSIHINVLMGPYTKGESVLDFFETLKDEDVINREESFSSFVSKTVAFGDSRNDESVFSIFPLSIGNKNVKEKESTFVSLPSFFIPLEGGDAFACALDILLSHCNTKE